MANTDLASALFLIVRMIVSHSNEFVLACNGINSNDKLNQYNVVGVCV